MSPAVEPARLNCLCLLPACDLPLLKDVADDVSQCDDTEARDKDCGIQGQTPPVFIPAFCVLCDTGQLGCSSL